MPQKTTRARAALTLASALAALALALAIGLPAAPARAAVGWLPVTSEDRAASASAIQPGAGAEILYHLKQIDDSKYQSPVTDEYLRIKAYNQTGAQAVSKIDIPYDIKTERVKSIAARVIKPDGTIIDVDKKAFYDREIVKLGGVHLRVRSFALPGVEPGSIVEYKWTTTRKTNIFYLKLDLADEMPARRVVFRLKPLSIPGYSTEVYFNKCTWKKAPPSKDGFIVVEMHDLPAALEEPFMPPADDVRPWMMFYPFKNFAGDNWSAYAKTVSDPLEKRLAQTSDDLRNTANRIINTAPLPLPPPMPGFGTMSDGQFKLQIALDLQLKPAKEVIASSTALSSRETPRTAMPAPPPTPAKKLERLCDYCRANIANIDFYVPLGGIDPKLRDMQNRAADDIIKTKLATSADLQFVFIALARAAGFDARAAFCSNRGVGLFRKNLWFPQFLPDPIVAVRLDGAWKYYDPAHCLVPSGKLRWQNSPATVLILLRNGVTWGETPPPSPEDSLVKRTGAFRLAEDGTLFGHLSINYGDIAGADAREAFFLQTQEKIEEIVRARVQARIPLAEVSNVRAYNANDPLKPFTLSYSVTAPGYAEITGQRTFLQPGFFEKGKAAMFTSDTRASDICFNYPINEKDEVTMLIPPWLKTEESNPPKNIETADWGKYLVTLSLNQKTGELSYTREFVFSLVRISDRGYTPLKTLFNTIRERDTHTLMLRAGAAAGAVSSDAGNTDKPAKKKPVKKKN